MAASNFHKHSNQLNTNDTAYRLGLSIIPPGYDTYPEELALSPPITNLEQEPGSLLEKQLCETPGIASQSPSLPIPVLPGLSSDKPIYEKPCCCRQFASRGNFRRHQYEKSEASFQCTCPTCGKSTREQPNSIHRERGCKKGIRRNKD
ncbi:hypothetical protein HD806DRAFT_395936 [Xylariaceae sp. AK1471]|nr:hypothetical protein HD806DRAFT_395936 [Xylariaceae sp. AK1471]